MPTQRRRNRRRSAAKQPSRNGRPDLAAQSQAKLAEKRRDAEERQKLQDTVRAIEVTNHELWMWIDHLEKLGSAREPAETRLLRRLRRQR
jgi:hypothetical protein